MDVISSLQHSSWKSTDGKEPYNKFYEKVAGRAGLEPATSDLDDLRSISEEIPNGPIELPPQIKNGVGSWIRTNDLREPNPCALLSAINV